MQSYINSNFNKDFTRHCSLIFQLEETKYSYAIYEKRGGNLQVLKVVELGNAGGELLNRLKVSVTSEDFLQVPFHDVKIAFAFSPFTLIPRVLFEEQMVEKYLPYSAEVNTKDTVLVNTIKGAYIKNIFSVKEEEHNFLHEVFPNAKFFHVGTSLVAGAFRNKETFNLQQILLDIKPNLMHIIYFENGELKFLNQFRFLNKEDFLYYVLLVADQFNIDRQSCDLKLSGEIVPDSMLFSELWKYFNTISFSPVNENIILPKELQETPMYLYNSLFSLDICE